MVKARDIQEPWMDRVPDKWKQSYTSPVKIPPQLRADPEGIFEFYQKRGLIDPEYKSIVDWQNAVLKRANGLGMEIAPTLNKMNLQWLMSRKGKKILREKFGPKQFKQLEQAMKRNPNAVGPFKFVGIPIERVRYKSEAEAIADGWKIKGKRLPFRTLQASPRAYGERIPLEMEDWFKTLEAKGTIPKGTFDKYSKWVYTINDANKARATNFSKRVGLPKHFNKGHLAAILNNTYFGGSNDPASQVVELTLENIKHGATDAISLEDMRKLDLPTNWGESAAYFMVNELGIEDNRILTGTGLPMRWSGKDMILDSDIARITRFGENADVILAETQNRIEQLAQEIEANRVAGLGDSESLKRIQSRMVDGRYIPDSRAVSLAKAQAPAKIGSIQRVIKRLNNQIGSATLGVVPLAGLALGEAGLSQTLEDYENNPNIINAAQTWLARGELAGEGLSAAGLGASATGIGAVAGVPMMLAGEAISQAAGWTDIGLEVFQNRDAIWEAVSKKENQEWFIDKATQAETYRQLGGSAAKAIYHAPGNIADYYKDKFKEEEEEQPIETSINYGEWQNQ